MRYALPSLPVLLSGLMLLPILGGCATMTGSVAPTDDAHAGFCDVAEPIYWSVKDTDATIEAVKEHNAVGKKLCGWGK